MRSSAVEESLKKLRARINEITTAQLIQPNEDKDNFLQALNSPTKVMRIERDIQVEDLRALSNEKEIIELTRDFFQHHYQGGIEKHLFDMVVLNQAWVKQAAILFAELPPSVKWLKFDVFSEPYYFKKVCDQLKSIVPSRIKIYFYNNSAAALSHQYSKEDQHRLSYTLVRTNNVPHEAALESTFDVSSRYDEEPAETDDEEDAIEESSESQNRNDFRNALLKVPASNRVKVKRDNFRVDEIKSISPEIEIVELMSGFFKHYKIHTDTAQKSALPYINAGMALLASIPDTVKWLVFDRDSAMFFGVYYYGIIVDVLKQVTSPHVTIYIDHKTEENNFELLRVGEQLPTNLQTINLMSKDNVAQLMENEGIPYMAYNEKPSLDRLHAQLQGLTISETPPPSAAVTAPIAPPMPLQAGFARLYHDARRPEFHLPGATHDGNKEKEISKLRRK